MVEVEKVTRIDKVTTRRGAVFWRLHTLRGNLYFAERPDLLGGVRPGEAVELEYEDRAGYRFIKALRLPDQAARPARLPLVDEPQAAARESPEPPAHPSSEAGADRAADPALKAAALEAALRLLSVRGRPVGVDELLETAERILSWLR